MTLIGNVMRAGPSTPDDVALFMLGGSGDIELYRGRQRRSRSSGRAAAEAGPLHHIEGAHHSHGEARAAARRLAVLRSIDVEESVIRNAGARPWDRDPIDARIVADTVEGRGEIIDNEEQVGGYPQYKETRQPFNAKDWDLATMTPRVEFKKGNIPR